MGAIQIVSFLDSPRFFYGTTIGFVASPVVFYMLETDLFGVWGKAPQPKR